MDDKTPLVKYETRRCPHCKCDRRTARVVGDNEFLCTVCVRTFEDEGPKEPKERK